MSHHWNKPKRRSIRLKEYDYTSPGWYYITISTHNREHMFGDINNGKMVLNTFGKIVEYHWQGIPHHFKHVELDEFVIMPNHVHGILAIVGLYENVGAKHSNSDRPIKNVNADRNASPLQSTPSNTSNRPKGTQPGSISAVVQNFSSVTTRKINRIRKTPGTKLWQRNFYDRVIRNDRELHNIRKYIMENPAKWELDNEHPDNRRKFNNN